MKKHFHGDFKHLPRVQLMSKSFPNNLENVFLLTKFCDKAHILSNAYKVVGEIGRYRWAETQRF